MEVLILERVPQGLRGELTRWFLEPKTGVFVGRVSAIVREKLWEKACGCANGGACILIHAGNNEQGFRIRSWGKADRSIEDFDGLYLIRRS